MAVTIDPTIFATFNLTSGDGIVVIDARMVTVRGEDGRAIAVTFAVCENGNPACDRDGTVLAPENATDAVVMAADRAGWSLAPAVPA